MKFNVELPDDIKEYLENQYKEYIKIRTMTKKEQRAVREWVKDGNSVYDNPEGAWLDGGVRMEYLDIYRDNEYIRQHTKGMSGEETRRFALAYYGWDDDPDLEIDDSENTWDDFLEPNPDAVPFA
ncbi:MAG: hypothetical protein K6G24_05870 [Lachnospiraceae bacterium]|nr:hypothetical protein [Lachnospiraceae bacterium]